LSVKVGKAGKAAPHAAYIAREGQYAHRLERAEKLEATEAGNMPAWAQSKAQAFWQAADAFERKNGTTYREMEIALPRELDAGRRAALVREFVRQEIGERHAYQWAIHTPTAADGGEQPHVHLMFSERQRDGIARDPQQYFKRYNAKAPEKGGARKGYGPNAGQTLTRAERAAELKELRGRWQAMCNTHLERAEVAQRIDMRSHAERGTGLEPERKQLPSQWRGQGRANVIAFRQARAELAEARAELARAVPDARAEVINLDAERQRRERQRRDEAQRQADPAETLRAWLTQPPIALRGSTEGLSRQSILNNVAACQDSGTPPAWLLGEAERVALRQAGWLDARDDLTPKGLGAVQHHIQQAAERQRREEATRKAEQEQQRQRRDEAQRLAAERQQEQEQEQERLNAQTAAGSFDGIRAPRRTPADWQQWRAHVLTNAYGDAVEVAALARTWRVQRAKGGQPLTLWGTGGQSIEDYGDRICPSGDDRRGGALQDDTLRTALQLARLKGWGQGGAGLDITGSSAFRERAARQAVRLGMTVANADLQAIVADEQAKQAQQAQQQAPRPAERLAAFPTETVDRSAPHAAKPAPGQQPSKCLKNRQRHRQARSPQPCR
jgi:hypothetical protein